MKCKIHNKELDMICQDNSCLKAICSSCVLFGDHKNHKYCQIDSFFSSVTQISSNVKIVKRKIEESKTGFQQIYKNHKIFEKLEILEDKLCCEMENNFDLFIQKIEKEKQDKKKDLKFYFQNLKFSIEKYFQDYFTKISNSDSSTEELFSFIFEEKNIPENVITAFEFKKKVEDFKIFNKAKQILDYINKSEKLILSKMTECLNSVEIKYNENNLKYAQINKKNLVFSTEESPIKSPSHILYDWKDISSDAETLKKEEEEKQEINLLDSNSEETSKNQSASVGFSQQLNNINTKIEINISELDAFSDHFDSKSTLSDKSIKKNDYIEKQLVRKISRGKFFENNQLNIIKNDNSKSLQKKIKKSVENIYFTQSK